MVAHLGERGQLCVCILEVGEDSKLWTFCTKIRVGDRQKPVELITDQHLSWFSNIYLGLIVF